MLRSVQKWLPEVGLFALLLFLSLRELGTFPAAWADDSLFMIVARNIAEGKGYALIILGREWLYPYTLGVGPALIIPSALAIKAIGFSVASARLPMIAYLIAASTLFYFLARRMAGRTSALRSSLLLISLSAFINTGKPVLGEIPGVAFLLAGFFFLLDAPKRHWGRSVLAGLLFGIAVMTKLSYMLLFPALGLTFLVMMLRREWTAAARLAVTGVIALVPFVAWQMMELSSRGGILKDILFMLGGSEEQAAIPFSHIWNNPEILLRIPFLSYAVFFVLGILGSLKLSRTVPMHVLVFVWSLIVLFTLYYLSSFGWYRHVLPAHILLLLFVPAGAWSIFGKRLGVTVIFAIVVAQAWWQLTYKGASRSTAATEAAAILEAEYRDVPLVVQQAEIFVRLAPRPHWFFLTNPIMSLRLPEELVGLSPAQRCMPLVRKLSAEDQQKYSGRLMPLAGYFLIEPPNDCK
ncbi:glycosyltransferase family 39 protein [Candidatus Peregrinibacteria bacterium]|nr:glycosyltransferase family 39 protein [Candidatus Peregrinibacteria bacterium]